MKTKMVILFFLTSFILGISANTGEARADLVEAEDFSVEGPSDWQKNTRGGMIILKGPALTGVQNPFIAIRKEADESTIRSMERTKESYHRWKDLPDVKNKMLAFLMNVFKKSYGTDKFKFISCDYEDRRNFIAQHMILIDNIHNVKIHDAAFITKDEPTRGYSLIFMCAESHFDKYLPVFEKCMESFTLK